MRKHYLIIFTHMIMLGAVLSLSACNGILGGIYDEGEHGQTDIKKGSFSQINTSEYDEWTYISLADLKAVRVKIGKEHEKEIPDKWDLAIHRYDIKTNGGSGYETTFGSLEELKNSGKLPDEASFAPDVWTTDKIAIDMSGMMEGNIVYAESYRNEVLSRWLSRSGMPPTYTLSQKVYLLRTKEQTYAGLRFTNYRNPKGNTGYISFNFIYPFEVNTNTGAGAAN